jgi:hypothetical protein
MTDAPSHSSLGRGLVYEDRLPLRWRRVTVREHAHVEASNAGFLRVVQALEQPPVELTDEHPDVAREFHRLESKIDLMLDLLGRLLVRQIDLPAPVPVRLTAERLGWQTTDQPPEAGTGVEVELYLRPEYPHPLLLAGRVVEVVPAGAAKQVVVEFDALGEAVHDWLEKTIFRHHRRLVHAQRHPAPGR